LDSGSQACLSERPLLSSSRHLIINAAHEINKMHGR